MYPGFALHRQKGLRNEKVAGCGGNSCSFTDKQSPQSWAYSGDLLNQKAKSLLFPWGGGGGRVWLQMTGALTQCQWNSNPIY